MNLNAAMFRTSVTISKASVEAWAAAPEIERQYRKFRLIRNAVVGPPLGVLKLWAGSVWEALLPSCS